MEGGKSERRRVCQSEEEDIWRGGMPEPVVETTKRITEASMKDDYVDTNTPQ